MRILFFSPLFAPYANPEAIVNAKLVIAMINRGWDVDVVCRKQPSMFGYDYGSKWEYPWLQLRERTHEISYHSGGNLRKLVEVFRAWVRLGHPIIGCRWAESAFDYAIKLHDVKPYDVILSRSLPDVGHLPALAMAKKTKLPWIANWNDPSGAKNPPPAGDGINGRLGYLNERYIKEIASKASWLTFPSDRMRQYICRYLEQGKVKSSTIPHISMKIETHKSENDSFTLCYTGNLYAGRNPEIFFEAVRNFLNLKRIDQGFKLVLIGLESVGLPELIRKYSLENNVIVTGAMSYDESLKRSMDSNVLVVLEAPCVEGIYLPSKLIDYVQTGKPILAISPKIGTVSDIISKYGGGIAVDCTSVEAITRALIKLHEAWQNGVLYDLYGSSRLDTMFSSDAVVSAYEILFERLLKSKVHQAFPQ